MTKSSLITSLFLGLVITNMSVFAVTETAQQTPQNANDFIDKYSVPVQIVPPPKSQTPTTNDTDTSATPAPDTTSTTNTTNAVQPSPPAQIDTNTQQPQQQPYQPLHKKNIWEKLKTQPQAEDKQSKTTTDTGTETTDTNTGSEQISGQQDVERHNIYK